MSSEALEKKLIGVEGLSGLEEHITIDVYGVGTTALYSFDPLPPGGMDGPFDPPGPTGPGGFMEGLDLNYFDPHKLRIEPIGKDPSSPGCVKQNPDYLEGGTERYRQPEYDSRNGNHMNYETLFPGLSAALNIHIPMDEKDIKK